MMIYRFYIGRAFWINSFLILALFAFIPINDEGIEQCNNFLKSIRIVQVLTVVMLGTFFYLLVKRENSKFNEFYKSDKFYCNLIYVTVALGIPFTIHCVNWRITNVHGAIKVWEIAAYSVTLIYTAWIWIFRFGKQFIEIIDKKTTSSLDKFKFYGTLIITGFFLVTIILGHLSITTIGQSLPFIEENAMLLSIILIFLTYFLFDKISSKVIKLTKSELDNSANDKEITKLNEAIKECNEEFTFGLKYMDRPMKWIFGIMLAYALYATAIDFYFDKKSMSELENFFGGAIAFELLLSSLIWAKTKI